MQIKSSLPFQDPLKAAANLSKKVSFFTIALPILLAAASISVGIYLFTSARVLGPGFPLDDAWIHQTYARSLASWGQWSYVRGEPSSGSTSPFWSLLLALGDVLRIGVFTWTYLLGGLALFSLSLSGELLFRRMTPGYHGLIPWAGLFLAGEWHLVWAAGSGMETVFYAFFVVLVFLLISRARGRSWGWVGLFIGLTVWIRPDALTLLGPALVMLLIPGSAWGARLRETGWFALGFTLLFGFYLLFNWLVQGSLMPNTFYAKQAEYAALLSQPIGMRFLDQVKLPLVGGGLFLLPGFILGVVNSIRRRDGLPLCAAVWFLGFALLYAVRLPVTYQYGRYLMAAMPIYFVLGMAGTFQILNRDGGRLVWILKRVFVLSLVGVWLAFYATAASFYARDVAIINTEMVTTARWVSENTPPGSVIAAHDIGALGYFSDRRLVDLAGLISPDVIPMIRDESALTRWLDSRGVDYLVTFPGWYSELPQGKLIVFQSNGKYSPLAGGENMTVYRWKK